MTSLCSFFVKTIKCQRDDSVIPISRYTHNDGVKVRYAREDEIDKVCEILSRFFGTKYSYVFEEKYLDHLKNMMKICLQENPWKLRTTLVAIENDEIKGVCSLKFDNQQVKRNNDCENIIMKNFSYTTLAKMFFSLSMNMHLSSVKPNQALIETLAIPPTTKNENVGRLLLEAAADECAERNYTSIVHLVLMKNFEEKKFFEQNEYHLSEMLVGFRFFMYGDDGYFKMEKSLV